MARSNKADLLDFDPFFEAYFTQHAEKLWEVTFTSEMAAAAQGQVEALDALDLVFKPDLRVAVAGLSWELLNAEARYWASNKAAELVKDISDDLRTSVREKITDWIGTGEHLDTLKDSLSTLFDEQRAELIASTEVTRAFAQGNLQVWERDSFSHEIKGKRWMTANDELVCEICGPLDQGMKEGLDSTWQDFADEPIQSPPAHPRCRCYMLPVLPGSSVRTTSVPPAPIDPDGWPPKLKPMTKDPSDPNLNAKLLNDKALSFLDRGKDVYDDKERGRAKDVLISELSKRTNIPYREVNDFIHQWANTSNDDVFQSIQIQARTAKVFNTKLSPWQEKKFNAYAKKRSDYLKLNGSYANMDSQFFSIFESGYSGTLHDELLLLGYKNSDEVVDDLLKAMYQYTQEELSKAGITEVFVYRGLDLGVKLADEIARVGRANLHGYVEVSNAAESWSSRYLTASGFGSGYNNGVIGAIIPAERILGTARTGFGCLNEYEYVILGGLKDDLIRVVR